VYDAVYGALYVVCVMLCVMLQVKGAVDNLDRILRTLAHVGYPREAFHIHCDGTRCLPGCSPLTRAHRSSPLLSCLLFPTFELLFPHLSRAHLLLTHLLSTPSFTGALLALMLPFFDHAPEVSFARSIDSITVSGHKMLGCPMPCADAALTQCTHLHRIAHCSHSAHECLRALHTMEISCRRSHRYLQRMCSAHCTLTTHHAELCCVWCRCGVALTRRAHIAKVENPTAHKVHTHPPLHPVVFC
jgi:hypothetical protein